MKRYLSILVALFIFAALYIQFSGKDVDDNHFIAEMPPEYFAFPLDEDIIRQAGQGRRDGVEWYAEGRKKNVLFPSTFDYEIADPHNRDIALGYYLQDVPLANEEPVSVDSRSLYWNFDKEPKTLTLSKTFDLSATAYAQLDSSTSGSGRQPRLSQMINLSKLGLSAATQARLDSLYANRRSLRLSEIFDLPQFRRSAARVEIDSFYERSDRSYRIVSSSAEYAIIDTTGRRLTLYVPMDEMDDQGYLRAPPMLSEHLDLSGLGLSAAAQSQLDSMYERRRPVKAFEELDLSGMSAPDFTAYDLDCQPVSLSQFQGQAVFLYFWASWCGPCISALPDLQNIKQKVAGQPVVFLNLSLDSDEGNWRKAIAKHRIEGIHLRVGGWSSDAAIAYSVGRLPSYYLIDAQGLVVERLSGVRNTPQVVAKIAESVYPSGG